MTETRTARSEGPPRRGLILTAMCLGMFLMQLDATIVNVALPAIGTHLHASVSGLQWVVDAYILPLAALLLIAGRVGDISGHKRVFVAGTTIFALANVACALAPSGGWLVTARAVQGCGAAFELPATLAILAQTFPVPAERARAIGIWASAAGLSLVAGPVLGGVLVDTVGWQAIFWLNVPCAAATGVLALAVVPGTRGSRAALDLPGQSLGTVALGLVAYVAIDGHRQGWTSPPIIGALLVALVALAGFAVVESRARDALLPPRFFRIPSFATGNAAGLLMGFVLFGLLFVFSLYFQQVGGDSAVVAGARFLPLSVAYVVTGPYAGGIIGRLGARWALTTGLVLVGAGCSILAVTAADGYLLTALPFLAVGVGYALASTSMAATVMGAVPPERAGMASSVNNTARQTGGVLGVAVLGSLLAPHTTASGSAGWESGLHHALWITAVCALAGAVLAGSTLPGQSPVSARSSGSESVDENPPEVARS